MKQPYVPRAIPEHALASWPEQERGRRRQPLRTGTRPGQAAAVTGPVAVGRAGCLAISLRLGSFTGRMKTMFWEGLASGIVLGMLLFAVSLWYGLRDFRADLELLRRGSVHRTPD